MSLIPTIYRSTDPGAPQLTGQPGALISLLRAVLVTGYGTSPNSKPAAGWTEPFTGTNKAVFRNSPATGTGAFLSIDDSATVAGSDARVALMRAFKSMSDISTGLDPAPTVAQRANGVPWLKSTSIDAVARGWVVIATEKWFYIFIALGSTAYGPFVGGVPYYPNFAGDLQSRKPGDAYHFMVSNVYGSGTGPGYSTGNLNGFLHATVTLSGTGGNSGWVLRGHDASVGAKQVACLALADGATSKSWGTTGSYPDPVGGELMYQRGMVGEGQGLLRGFMPGIYVPLHAIPLADQTVLSNVNGLPIGTQLVSKSYSQDGSAPGNSAAYSGQLLFDITNEA